MENMRLEMQPAEEGRWLHVLFWRFREAFGSARVCQEYSILIPTVIPARILYPESQPALGLSGMHCSRVGPGIHCLLLQGQKMW